MRDRGEPRERVCVCVRSSAVEGAIRGVSHRGSAPVLVLSNFTAASRAPTASIAIAVAVHDAWSAHERRVKLSAKKTASRIYFARDECYPTWRVEKLNQKPIKSEMKLSEIKRLRRKR
jgi:hypothetical protein